MFIDSKMALKRAALVAVPLAVLATSCAPVQEPAAEGEEPTTTIAAQAPDTAASGQPFTSKIGCQDEDERGDFQLRFPQWEPRVETEQLLTLYAVNKDSTLTLCRGPQSEALEESWAELNRVANPQDLSNLTLVGSVRDPDSSVGAYVSGNLIDKSQLFVNEETLSDDRVDYVMIHEFAHALQSKFDQFEILPQLVELIVEEEQECDFRYENVCFEEDSYLAKWANQFWSAEDLAAPTGLEETETEAQLADFWEKLDERCENDPGFPTSYSASSPLEDFAESLSFYVYGTKVPNGVEPRFDFFDDYPEFVEMRNRAEANSETFGTLEITNATRCE